MMKRIFLLFLFSLAVPGDPAAASNTTEVIQPFSSVLWTTTTLHSPGGKTFIFTRRTLYTRDALGTTRREMHQPTKGLQHDTTAALERVLIGTTSAQAVSGTRSRNETLVEDVDLGTLKFSGLPASGRRQSFQDASGQRTRTVETWFCATLGTTVHTESSNAHGDITVSDLSDLHLGNPVPVASEMTPANPPAVPLLHLYQGLFGLVANMERDRQANDSNRKVNMDEIEDHLRKQVNLSTREWQLLVAKSVDVQKYTLDLAKQARVLIDREHAARQQGLASGGTWADAHGKLHSMQQDLNTHVQGEIHAGGDHRPSRDRKDPNLSKRSFSGVHLSGSFKSRSVATAAGAGSMKRAHRLWLVIFCAVAYSVATGHLSPTERLYAQANSDVYNDERVYIASYISVDGSYNLYATSSMTVLFGEQWDGIELFGYVDGDGSYSGSDYANGVDNAEVSLESSGPVTPGHTYTLESDGYACISYNGNGGEGDFYDCEYDPVGSAYATVYVLPPPPLIASLSPSSVNQGDQGTLTITGTNFIETAADQLTLTFSGTYNPFTLTSAPSTCTSTCTATFSYEFSGYPPGTYSLWLANDEAESEPVSFTVALPIQSALPLDPCAVVSSSQVGFTSIVPTGTSSGSGTLTVSFSGAAFAMVNQSVSYGPYSTPSSIAASMAALITRNYARYGLTAKAFGRNVIYSGTATTSSGSGTVGLVTNVFSGNGGVPSSFLDNPSPTAANEAGLACESAPPLPPTPGCGIDSAHRERR